MRIKEEMALNAVKRVIKTSNAKESLIERAKNKHIDHCNFIKINA